MKSKLCEACDGSGWYLKNGHHFPCETCDGVGDFGIDPSLPTQFAPNTDGKVLVMRARYNAGLPLWNSEDFRYPITHHEGATL